MYAKVHLLEAIQSKYSSSTKYVFTRLVQILSLFAKDRVQAQKVLELAPVSLVVVKFATKGFVLL